MPLSVLISLPRLFPVLSGRVFHLIIQFTSSRLWRLPFPMKTNSIEHQPTDSEFAVYDCEIHLKFRLIEEKNTLLDRDQLLEMLLEALSYGADEYLEPIHTQVNVQEVAEVEASPQMRRQLIRLRNSNELL